VSIENGSWSIPHGIKHGIFFKPFNGTLKDFENASRANDIIEKTFCKILLLFEPIRLIPLDGQRMHRTCSACFPPQTGSLYFYGGSWGAGREQGFQLLHESPLKKYFDVN
jgi:hypothetical protein